MLHFSYSNGNKLKAFVNKTTGRLPVLIHNKNIKEKN